jgi:hypothetical protein
LDENDLPRSPDWPMQLSAHCGVEHWEPKKTMRERS